MNPAVPFRSILFERPSDLGERKDPSMFRDLNLDQVFAAVAAGRDEYDLMPFFSAPLRDVGAVEYRHQVQRDLADAALSGAVADFALRMREMRKSLAQSGKLRTRYQKEYWFLDAASIYGKAVSALAEALVAIKPGSRGFTAFGQYLADYSASAAFTGLAADIARVTSELAAVRYCVNIKGARVRVTRYEGEADYSAEVQRTFAKFAANAVKDYRVGFRNWPDMNHVEARILDLVARLYPDVFQALDEFCARHAAYLDDTIRVFDREVHFYAAYLDFTAPMKEAGLDFCYPAVSRSSKQISARSAVDLALAAKLMPLAATVVSNDFYLDGPERIFLMYPDRDFDLDRDLPPNEAELSGDLELDVLLRAMASGDKFLFDVARQGIHSRLTDPAEIVYRQHVLADCIGQPGVVRDLYDVAVAAIAGETRTAWS